MMEFTKATHLFVKIAVHMKLKRHLKYILKPFLEGKAERKVDDDDTDRCTTS